MIVAVCGGRPNVGASTVAVNLAREREGVVVDGDLAFADRSRRRGPDFHDVLAGRASSLEVAVDDGSVGIVPCGRSLEDAEAVDSERYEAALESLDRTFGDVVVDCPPGTGEGVAAVLEGADAAVIVTTATDAALVGAARTKRLTLETATPVAAVVRNRAPTVRPATADDRVRALECGLGEPVVEVTDRTTVRVARALGRPVRDVAPDGDVVDRFASLAAALDGDERRTPATVP